MVTSVGAHDVVFERMSATVRCSNVDFVTHINYVDSMKELAFGNHLFQFEDTCGRVLTDKLAILSHKHMT